MLDDIGKFLFRLVEKNSDDVVRSTKSFWDNYLVQISPAQFLRFIRKQVENGQLTIDDLIVPSIVGIAIFVSVVLFLLRKHYVRRHAESDGA